MTDCASLREADGRRHRKFDEATGPFLRRAGSARLRLGSRRPNPLALSLRAGPGAASTAAPPATSRRRDSASASPSPRRHRYQPEPPTAPVATPRRPIPPGATPPPRPAGATPQRRLKMASDLVLATSSPRSPKCRALKRVFAGAPGAQRAILVVQPPRLIDVEIAAPTSPFRQLRDRPFLRRYQLSTVDGSASSNT